MSLSTVRFILGLCSAVNPYETTPTVRTFIDFNRKASRKHEFLISDLRETISLRIQTVTKQEKDIHCYYSIRRASGGGLKCNSASVQCPVLDFLVAYGRKKLK